jgi:hypothetical protein
LTNSLQSSGNAVIQDVSFIVSPSTTQKNLHPPGYPVIAVVFKAKRYAVHETWKQLHLFKLFPASRLFYIKISSSCCAVTLSLVPKFESHFTTGCM